MTCSRKTCGESLGHNRCVLPKTASLGREIQPKYEQIGPHMVKFRIIDPKFAAGSEIS